MALTDTATLVIDGGNYYTAVYSSSSVVAPPTTYTAPPVAYTKIGHTSLSQILNITSEGGDATIIATLQNRALRTTYSDRIDRFNVDLQQFDAAALKLYYGSNATVGTSGEIQVPVKGTPTIATFLAVFTDGANSFSIYAPKAEIFRADDIAVTDTASLATLPLSVKPLIHGSNAWTYHVTPLT